jgi:hypothetical protein
MTSMLVDDRVLLTLDIPELGLHRGDLGTICSIWSDPAAAFEVEFQKPNPDSRLRALLMVSQITRALKVYGPLTRGETQ